MVILLLQGYYIHNELVKVRNNQKEIKTTVDILRKNESLNKQEQNYTQRSLTQLNRKLDDISRGEIRETFTATAYTYTGNLTYTETVPREGIVAVDPAVIPLNSIILVECDSYPAINGVYRTEDTGGAIKGRRIDIYLNSQQKCINFGNRVIRVTLIRKG
jgi:3D (Asp-Asp-Asp) domain-containing protein